MTAVMFIILGLCFLVGVPIAFSLGLASAIAAWLQGFPLITIAQPMFASLDSFPLMAVPFFILAGKLMETGGIAQRLVNLANSIVGGITGGLGAVVVLTSMFFATISGASSATAAAVGSIMIPAMVKKGYPVNFAAAVQASSAELGVIIPPSISMIIYGVVTGVSIGDLFIAGILPGFLVGGSLILTVYIYSKIKGYDVGGTTVSWKERLVIFKDALLALFMPIIILGGIYGGVFTPTEASVVAVVYGFVVGLFIYKEIKWKDVMRILKDSAYTSAVVMILVATASIFAWMLTRNQVPQTLGRFLNEFTDSAILYLLLVNVLLLLTGMFVETLASIIILAPILAPVAMQYGIDPVHFGLIMVVNLAVGMVTPPVGVNLFITCGIAKIRLDEIVRPLLIFLAVLIIDVMIISYLPKLSTLFL